MKLFAATTNAGKLRDFAAAAVGLGVEIEAVPGLAAMAEPEETEASFAGNAALKAMAYSRLAPGLLVLADDSGIEVEALAGAPGVRSARYAEDAGYVTRRPLPADQRNNLCLLDALASTRDGERGARYRCALAVARDGKRVAEAEGSVEGEILAVPRGNGGFGYDPLFLLPEEGVTMAEVAAEQRSRFSHRGRALEALLAKLDGMSDIAQS